MCQEKEIKEEKFDGILKEGSMNAIVYQRTV